VAQASKNRSLADFEKALTDYRAELRDDPIISTHLAKLYDNLLEQNLIRVIEPFSRVQIEHISSLIKLSKVRSPELVLGAGTGKGPCGGG